MPFRLKNQFDITYALDRGVKRKESPNQDALVILKSQSKHKLPPLLVLADGMGGYAGGVAASKAVIHSFSELYKLAIIIGDYPAFAQKAIGMALRKMKSYSEKDPRFDSMGSTLVAVWLLCDKIALTNVGDSRAYVINKTGITQVSYDHSFVGEAIRVGLITKEEARNHPKKNQLTQSITPRRPEINPYFAEVPFKRDDTVLLCSDGLWGVVPEEIIQSVVNELPPQKATDQLVKLANAGGGPDNISVIVARHQKKKGDQQAVKAEDSITLP